MTQIALDELRALALAGTRSFGYSDDDAAIIVDVLMYAQLRGNNQGVVKLVNPGIPMDASATPVTIDRDGACLSVDGGRNHAMVVVTRAVDEVVGAASENGMAAAGIRGLCTSSGAIGFYARRMADAGFIGIVLAGASPTVAPAGSNERLFGTNPLAIAIPGASSPVVLDMATAAMAFFGVVEASIAGRRLPEGIAYDEAGEPTTDPQQALSGSLTTFEAGPKSSGLAFMVQALTGPLVGASYFGLRDVDTNWGGHLVMALDPSRFAFASELQGSVEEMSKRVRASRRIPGVDRIAVPGELGDERATAAVAAGTVEVEDNLLAGLRKIASGP